MNMMKEQANIVSLYKLSTPKALLFEFFYITFVAGSWELQYKNIVYVASAIGLVFSLLGLFLPWGQEEWGQVLGIGGGYLFGVELLLGAFALIGSIVSLVFLLFYTRRNRKSSAILMLVGSLIILFSSLAWIVNPNIAWRWSLEQGVFMYTSLGMSYRVLYGAFITLFGSVLTSFMRVFNFFVSIYARDSPK